ncbi:deoxyribose-phosphate aldolase [Enterococcus hirae]|jgi:deoxyribose-phosphate aldolase|nr:deoxyribose-phosphate aldolase [Enterococcaceae bacterium]MDM8214199.1 deoxyribose-phosphate aldolase [Enterococcus hirae]
MEINQYIDHTLLKPDATRAQIKKIIEEAKEYKFFSVCINPFWVPLAHEELKDTSVKVCTVIGFPLGANTSAVKEYETTDAIKNGANEVDMVINIGALKGGEYEIVKEDIQKVVAASEEKALVKVIIESSLLTDEEIVKACELAKEAGADFVKTSTGFANGGASVHAVELMRKTVGSEMGVKASGGIHSYEDAKALIDAGATRIGASAGIAIVEGAK